MPNFLLVEDVTHTYRRASEDTTEGLLEGFVTHEYGNSRLVRIGILIVSGTGSNLYSVKTTASLYFEGYGMENNLYSFVLGPKRGWLRSDIIANENNRQRKTMVLTATVT